MKNFYNKRGFTLIELLVVVLIIGILASVALPQYEKAVNRSRAAGYMATLKPLLEASQVCYMATGDRCNMDELDVEAPECRALPDTYQCDYVSGPDGSSMQVDFYLNESSAKHWDFAFVLTKEGHRVCCGRKGAEMCPKYGYKNIDASLEIESCGELGAYVEGKPGVAVVGGVQLPGDKEKDDGGGKEKDDGGGLNLKDPVKPIECKNCFK